MKKLTLVLIIIISILTWGVKKTLPSIFLDSGKKDYDKGNYQAAYHNLKISLYLNHNNGDTRYYYVKTLINSKPTFAIQKEIYNISEGNLSDAASFLAKKQISIWKDQIFSNIGRNYIEKTPYDGKVLRWDSSKFPLTVCLKNNSSITPSYYEPTIKTAFYQWQISTNNFIRFEFTNDEKESNINVTINPQQQNKKCDSEDCKYAIAYTEPSISGNLLSKMNIIFYDSNNLGSPFTQTEIYTAALHEIGHSLGIMGHSDDKNDIMYMETETYNSTDRPLNDLNLISSSDLNTLNLLYQLNPSITNTSLFKFKNTYNIFAPIIIGNQEQVSSKKIQEAQKYIESAPNLPNGYIDLASAYADNKQYKMAIESLDKALSFCSNDNDKFIVYYNYGILYTETKDWENALKYTTLANQINATKETNGLLGAINYNIGNKEKAKELYNQAIQKSPDDIICSYSLALIYTKEFKFREANKILYNLISTNPDAKNDPKIAFLYKISLLLKVFN